MKRFILAVMAIGIVAAVMSSAALAWPNTVTGEVTGKPVCNKATGQFEGGFSVSWTVTNNVDQGFELTDVSPASPAAETYPLADAGQTKSFSFVLTQTKYLRIGDLKIKIKQESATFTGSVTLPELGECVKDTPPPIGHDCEFVGADKDGGKDAYGGTNDDCAPRPTDKPKTVTPTLTDQVKIVYVDRIVEKPVVKTVTKVKVKVKKVVVTKVKVKKVFVPRPDKPKVCGKGLKLYKGVCAVMGSG